MALRINVESVVAANVEGSALSSTVDSKGVAACACWVAALEINVGNNAGCLLSYA